MAAMTFMVPPQSLQVSTLTFHTFCKSLAQARRKTLRAGAGATEQQPQDVQYPEGEDLGVQCEYVAAVFLALRRNVQFKFPAAGGSAGVRLESIDRPEPHGFQEGRSDRSPTRFLCRHHTNSI